MRHIQWLSLRTVTEYDHLFLCYVDCIKILVFDQTVNEWKNGKQNIPNTWLSSLQQCAQAKHALTSDQHRIQFHWCCVLEFWNKKLRPDYDNRTKYIIKHKIWNYITSLCCKLVFKKEILGNTSEFPLWNQINGSLHPPGL